MKVTLLNHTPNPEETIAMAAKLCYSPSEIEELKKELTEEKTQKFINRLIKMGHESPFEHVTFTFGIEGVSRACYDKDTEVLTKEGWKLLKEVQCSDEVLTINSDTLEAEFQKVENTMYYKYTGDMHHYLSQNIDLMVTPNHQIFMKKYDVRKPDNFHLCPSEEITNKRFYMLKTINYKRKINKDFIIKGYSYQRKNNKGEFFTKILSDYVINREAFYKLLAWYISEGSCYRNEKENSYEVSISQLKQENIEHIKQIINNCGIHCYYDGQAIKFKNLVIGKYLSQIGKSFNKKIPFNIFDNFNKDLAQIFLEEYIKGDGTIDKNNCSKIYTISEVLKDQIYTLCYIAGWTASYHIDNRVGQSHLWKGRLIRNNYPCYVINISCSGQRNYQPVIKKDKHFSTIFYDDFVYCLEVPNHTIFVRRNGLAYWCGNCSHQLVRHRIASYSQQSQRYVDGENFDYVVPHSIEESTVTHHFPDDAEWSTKDVFNLAMKAARENYITLRDDLYYSQVGNWFRKHGFIASTNDYRNFSETNKKEANLFMKKACEDARYVLPNATTTKIICTFDVRSLWNFFKHRLCNRAQWEIREVAEEMLKLCIEVAPALFKKCGPNCVHGKCGEGSMSCGLAEEVKEKYNEILKGEV